MAGTTITQAKVIAETFGAGGGIETAAWWETGRLAMLNRRLEGLDLHKPSSRSTAVLDQTAD